ncbi:Holliday junction resolvase RuvX [Kangiella sp. HZ709]|uniref:Holliday junction resolvase RuvX n=1 Tax=Kangiella sp. HZ709 TaxID=2666328 RepID=UPI0012AF6F7E|nr:Holliday junction resolvase RuvX [Kangiella sp. HZ709]MRX28113.1 Holliday junction resolvase RuvX [Kangiella sp. HZ709]
MSDIKKYNRFLAFDYGEKRTGVATGNLTMQTTQALTVLSCHNDQPNWLDIESIINEWQVEAFVVGLPLNMDGSEQEITIKAKKFGNRLHGRFGLPLFFHDERLSSVEVKEYLFELGGYKKVCQDIDAYAAELILKSFFAENLY